MLHGLNFFVIIVLFTLLFIKKQKITIASTSIAIASLVILCTLGYGIFSGLLNNQFTAVVIYFRLFSTGIFLFWIGFWLAERTSENILANCLVLILIALLLFGVIELLFPEIYVNIINANHYQFIKREYMEVPDTETFIQANQKKLFNLKIFKNIQVRRLSSLSMHTISFGYILCSLGLFCIFKKKYTLAILSFIGIVIFTFSKGPILAFLLTIVIFGWKRVSNFSFSSLVLVLVPFWIIVVYLGARVNNEHIEGFLNGLQTLSNKPLGSGFGYGGNFNRLPGERDFSKGTESALGLLFSNLGFLSFLYFSSFVRITNNVFNKVKGDKRLIIIPISALIFLFQGIFQEEAYSPYAIGIILFLTGYYGNSGAK